MKEKCKTAREKKKRREMKGRTEGRKEGRKTKSTFMMNYSK